MKIGIMTFWWAEDNYGQLLQCYALQKYLRDAGYDAYLIRYDPTNDYIKTPLWKKILKACNPGELYKFLKFQKQINDDKREKQISPRGFEDFRNKHINQSEAIYHSCFELKENPPEADIYIVGSDQVWNIFDISIDRAVNVIRAYLLDFGNLSTKRIAYAASFGKTQLDNASVALFSPLLKKFNYISVREKSGVEICKKCGIENAEWVPDPTLLIDIDTYRSLYKVESVRKPTAPYCFLYLLGNEYDFSIKTVYDKAKKMGIEVIYVTGNLQHDKFRKHYATIPEWIYLIEHAEYVITNSYHCSIFSLLFKKEFGVVPLKGIYADMNVRFDTLFQLFEIEQGFIEDDIFQKKQVQWDKVDNILKQMRSSCKLKSIIDGKN